MYIGVHASYTHIMTCFIVIICRKYIGNAYYPGNFEEKIKFSDIRDIHILIKDGMQQSRQMVNIGEFNFIKFQKR